MRADRRTDRQTNKTNKRTHRHVDHNTLFIYRWRDEVNILLSVLCPGLGTTGLSVTMETSSVTQLHRPTLGHIKWNIRSWMAVSKQLKQVNYRPGRESVRCVSASSSANFRTKWPWPLTQIFGQVRRSRSIKDDVAKVVGATSNPRQILLP